MRQQTLLLSLLLLACTQDKEATCFDLSATDSLVDVVLKEKADLKELYVDMFMYDMHKPTYPPKFKNIGQIQTKYYEKDFKFCVGEDSLNSYYGPLFCYNASYPFGWGNPSLKYKYWTYVDESPIYPKYCFDAVEKEQVIHEYIICYDL